ncbi:MAG: LacI family transcriptional regulator [Kiritimatiellaeota bacterium]|nr:LacI family transcriptional regulator [Kiritimatiellota bacterium]
MRKTDEYFNFSSTCRAFGVQVAGVVVDEAGAVSAVEHLASLGHKRIAFVGAERGSGYVESRRSGFFKGMESFELPVSNEYIVHEERIELIEGLTFELLALSDPPSAVICTSDYFAMVVKRAAFFRNAFSLRCDSRKTPKLVSVFI